MASTPQPWLAPPPALQRSFRLLWLLLVAVAAALVLAATPLMLAEHQQVCTGSLCLAGQVHVSQLKRFAVLGLSLESYGLLATGLQLACVAAYLLVAAVILWRRPAEPMAVLGACALLLFGLMVTGHLALLSELHPALFWLTFAVDRLAVLAVTLFFALFPSGRFVPRWARWLVPLSVAVDLVYALVPLGAPFPIGRLISLSINAWFISLAAIQIVRYHTVSTPAERQQTKWVVYGVAIGYGGGAFADLARQLLLLPALSAVAIPHVVWWNLGYALKLIVPLAFGLAILRARLYAVDVVAGRTLVYAALTALLVAVYALVAASLGALIPASGTWLPSLLAAGVIAVLFAPLHAWLQRGVNRLLFGQRDEPSAVLARLSHQLASTLEPAAVLPTIVQTVRQALRLSYVAVVVDQGGRSVAAAASGEPVAGLLRLPLRFQGEALGELILAPRAPGEGWSAADRRTLADLSEHAGTAVHAVLLTLELQQARARLISAREEERRRLRRDLHDGLGPTLASLTMQIDTARVLVHDDPATGAALLAEVQGQLKETLGNVRRLVYALRPPALDQFGLVAAIHEQVAREERPGGPCTVVEADPLPPLPAAVEVAAYYIATEALTNVRRHARAATCTVRLWADTGLRLEIEDDGVGLAQPYQPGIGLHSMRERATELGGTWAVMEVPAGGTLVAAWLPLVSEPSL